MAEVGHSLGFFSVESTDKEPGHLVRVKRGNGALPGVGTWAHPKLAVFFARWLDVRFAVWCDAVIEDILKGHAEVHITAPAAVISAPPAVRTCFSSTRTKARKGSPRAL